jgi:hypothetical protein
VVVRLDEAFAVPLDLLFLPFVFVAARAGRDFFVAADALVDRVALVAFACRGEALAAPATSAAVAVSFRSELDGCCAVVFDG